MVRTTQPSSPAGAPGSLKHRPSRAQSPERSAPAAAPAASRGTQAEVKTFVLDTNILLHNPNALFVFKEHHVVVPFMVIEELDKLKRLENDLGRNARETIRHLDRLRAIGRLSDGIDWGSISPTVGRGASMGENGKTGRITVDVGDYERPPAIAEDMPDNHIIAVAWHLKHQGKHAVFVTKDLSARIKSDSLGIITEDFENQKVDADRLYSGFVSVGVDGAMIDELYRDRMLPDRKSVV